MPGEQPKKWQKDKKKKKKRKEKIDLKIKNIIRDKEGHYIMIKG